LLKIRVVGHSQSLTFTFSKTLVITKSSKQGIHALQAEEIMIQNKDLVFDKFY